jgi:hypothetical protein
LKVSTDRKPNSRKAQTSAATRPAPGRIAFGSVRRLTRSSSAEYMNIIRPPVTAEMTSRTSGWLSPDRMTTTPIATRPQTRAK